jgi:hypothetical protein
MIESSRVPYTEYRGQDKEHQGSLYRVSELKIKSTRVPYTEHQSSRYRSPGFLIQGTRAQDKEHQDSLYRVPELMIESTRVPYTKYRSSCNRVTEFPTPELRGSYYQITSNPASEHQSSCNREPGFLIQSTKAYANRVTNYCTGAPKFRLPDHQRSSFRTPELMQHSTRGS